MLTASVVRVFTDSQSRHGNPVGIVLDEEERLDVEQRQDVARRLGFSETVFVDGLPDAAISFYSPERQVAFAGHAAVGVAWYLQQELGQSMTSLQGTIGPIPTWSADGATWVGAELRSMPPWCLERLLDVPTVESLTGPQHPSQSQTLLWAWIDETQGFVRARTFARAWGIPEDEANGSGCMRLASALGRALRVHHGAGSVVMARPDGPGRAAVGGRVTLDANRFVFSGAAT